MSFFPVIFDRRAKAQTYEEKILAMNPIAYWMQAETSGSTSICSVNSNQNGTYVGVTLGQTGIGDGNTSALWTLATSRNAIHSATFQGNFNGSEGTLGIWAANPNGYDDSGFRTYFRIYGDADNVITIFEWNVAGKITATYQAGGTSKNVNKLDMSGTGFIHLAVTWSATGDAFKLFIDGAQSGATQTSLGTWGAATLDSTNTNIGCNAPSSTYWVGRLAHCAVFDTVLSDADILKLATV